MVAELPKDIMEGEVIVTSGGVFVVESIYITGDRSGDWPVIGLMNKENGTYFTVTVNEFRKMTNSII